MIDSPAFIRPVMTSSEAQSIIKDCGTLGPDPSSKHFANRSKNIAFVLSISGQWFQIYQNYFIQPFEYNDLSGGYKRYYNELPRQFLKNKAAQHVLNTFKHTFNIPERELILVQVQSSNISPDEEGKCLTGHGIHSDGTDRAMLVCLERRNVLGARTSVYRDAEGKNAIIEPRVLKEGQVMFWKDNEIYHYVEPAYLENKSKHGSRTVMIAHYPVMHIIQGGTNPNNTLPISGKHPPSTTTIDA